MRKVMFAALLMLLGVTLAAAQSKAKVESVKIEEDQSYLVLSTKRIQTLEKELDEVASKGFRVLYGAPTASFDMALLLERLPADRATKPYSYKVLATSRIKTMEEELNAAVKQGYRLLPRTIIFKQGLLTAELVMLMEREPQPTHQYQYELVTAFKETKLHKKMDAVISQGFVPLTMITLSENVVVMEKATPVQP